MAEPLLVRGVMRIGVPTCKLEDMLTRVAAPIVMRAPGRSIVRMRPYHDGRLAHLGFPTTEAPKVLVTS